VKGKMYIHSKCFRRSIIRRFLFDNRI